MTDSDLRPVPGRGLQPPPTPEGSSGLGCHSSPGPSGARIGWWSPGEYAQPASLAAALDRLDEPVFVIERDGACSPMLAGRALLGPGPAPADGFPLRGFAAPIAPSGLGDAAFSRAHRIRFPYMAGSMANGIASTELVIAAARAGFLASYGAAGRDLAQIERALDVLDRELGAGTYCVNLIHSPGEPAHEEAVVDLLLRRGVARIEASAYLNLTTAVVRYRMHGIHRGADGRVVTPNRIIAKASRVEVATRWLSPPPPRLLESLVAAGAFGRDEATLALEISMADDLTAEADSGGHTDNQPAVTLVPTFVRLRDAVQGSGSAAMLTRIGAAGGIATPASVAAAFAMGAAYVVTGSINQACVESGSSDRVRQMLAQCGQADVAMAPAADMFELGVKLQVLKRGTLFPMRAAKLYELYRVHDGLDSIPEPERAGLERDLFHAPLDEIWQNTRAFFEQRDPGVLERAARNPKSRMALVFRWYLGSSSTWANEGVPDRQADYQVWCGPAMGAFNEWVRGTFLAEPHERRIAVVALNLLHGAAVVMRANSLRQSGLDVPGSMFQPAPQPLAALPWGRTASGEGD